MINIFFKSSRRGTLVNSFYVLNEHPNVILESTCGKIPVVLDCRIFDSREAIAVSV